jgi:hypothetical protein
VRDGANRNQIFGAIQARHGFDQFMSLREGRKDFLFADRFQVEECGAIAVRYRLRNREA